MKNKLCILAFGAAISSIFLISCSKDDDVNPIQISINTSYSTDKCKVIEIDPSISGCENPSIKWTIGDSVISTSNKLEFISNKAGTYKVNLNVTDSKYSSIKNFTISVDEKEYSNRVTKIIDYDPTFGPYVNDYVYNATTREGVINNINTKVISPTNEHLGIDLGLFGGSAVFAFDHTIINIPNHNDFTIKPYGYRGLGIVYIAYDRNKNGKPDADEWYEIPGALEGTSAIDPEYQVNLSNTREDDYNEYLSFNAWTDNKGNSGKYKYDLPEYASYKIYPSWIHNDYVLKGKRIIVESPSFNTSNDKYISYLLPSKNGDVCPFDISKAIDNKGNRVNLPGIDFIKITTAIFSETDDSYGYYSLAIDQIKDLHL